MTTFKFLLTLLSVAVVASANTLPVSKRQSTPAPAKPCDPAACVKAVASVGPAVSGCINAGADLGSLASDNKKTPKPDPAKTAGEVLTCVSGIITSAADMSGACPQCLQSMGGVAPAAPAI